MSSKYKLASRGSLLALWQANFASEKLAADNIMAEILTVRTTGDKNKETPLAEIGGKGVFVKELEQALLSKTADIAVHSLKDLPAQTRKPFALPCYFARHPAQDMIIFAPSWAKKLEGANKEHWQANDLRKLGPLKIGTGSLRRESLLNEASPQIRTVAIRGNVDTRLANLKEGKWDAIILAKASIHRLSISKEFPHFTLDGSWFIPCAGQGALVVETLDNHPLIPQLRALTHPETETAVSIERKILAFLGGDCNLPVGVHVFVRQGELCCDLVVYNTEGRALRMYITQGEAVDGNEFAELICGELHHAGVEAFLRS